MKKIYTVLAALAMPLIMLAEPAELPWSVVFKTLSVDDYNLDFINAYGPGSSASYQGSNAGWQFKKLTIPRKDGYVEFKTGDEGGQEENNFLITPQLTFPQAGKYKMTVNMKFSVNSNTEIRFFYGNVTEPVEPDNLATDFPESNLMGKIVSSQFDTDAIDYDIIFNVADAGDYRIAINNFTTANVAQKYYTIYSMNVEPMFAYPNQVTDLKAALDGEGVMLTWTNPSTNVDGDALSSLTKLEVYRNDELVSTITDQLVPGAQCSYTDFPTPGASYSYKVIPFTTVGEAYGTAPVVESGWVGDKLQTLPWQTMFRDASQYPTFSIVDCNEDGRKWNLSTSGATLLCDGLTGELNDVIYTPPFEIEPGYYTFRLNAGGGNSSSGLTVGYATEEMIDEGKFVSSQNIEFGSSFSDEPIYTKYFHIETAGRYVFGVKVQQDFTTAPSYDFKISIMYVEKADNKPGCVTDVTALPAADLALKATIGWTNPTTCNIPGAQPDIREIKILRKYESESYQEIVALTEPPYTTPGAKCEYIDNAISKAGNYSYKVEVYGDSTSASPQADAVSTGWIGGGLTAPYTADFSAWTIVNANNDGYQSIMGDLEDEYTWEVKDDGATIAYESSADADGNADDWAVSPRMQFSAGNYTISLKAWGTAPEGVNLYIGKSSDVADGMTVLIGAVDTSAASEEAAEAQLFTLKAVTETEPATLANVVTIPEGILYLGIHASGTGDYYISEFKLAELKTGINEITMKGMEFRNGILSLGEEADIYVYDTAGVTVASARSVSTIDLSALASGLYIVRAGNHAISIIK